MTRFARAWATLLGLLAFGAAAWVHAGPYEAVAGCVEGSLPGNDPRYPAAQLIVTCVPPPTAPAQWNGTLAVLVHGYVDPQDPLALPALDLDGLDALRTFLNLGFAVATTSFHKNGYAVEQGGEDVNALVRHFSASVAPPQHVALIGGSQGGLITTMLLEQSPGLYAGGLALCGAVGGAPLAVQDIGDFRAVFDYYFPQVFDFGVVNVPATAHLQWAAYEQIIRDAIAANPQAFEQLLRVTGVPRDPKDPLEAAIEATLDLLRFSVFGFNDVVETAGGNPYGNQNVRYTGSTDDEALNRGVERIAPDPVAKEYLERHYQPTGLLTRPLVTLHTTRDPIVPIEHEARYAERVRGAGTAKQLVRLAVDRYGHCNFRAGEVLGALALLADRADIPLSPALRAYLSEIRDLRRSPAP